MKCPGMGVKPRDRSPLFGIPHGQQGQVQGEGEGGGPGQSHVAAVLHDMVSVRSFWLLRRPRPLQRRCSRPASACLEDDHPIRGPGNAEKKTPVHKTLFVEDRCVDRDLSWSSFSEWQCLASDCGQLPCCVPRLFSMLASSSWPTKSLNAAPRWCAQVP